jgi:hypothetical protein
VTLLVYTGLALLLLTYVSAQVLTSVLTQEITELKQERHQRKEALNKHTSEYISMSSRARVTYYCESVLGMIPAGDGSLERFAVEESPGTYGQPVEFTRGFSQTNDPYRFTLLREGRKPGR